MIVSIDWLKDFVPVNEPASAIADRLIRLGSETEVLDQDRLDLEITPNRGDLLSIFGVAREYGASINQKPKMPPTIELQWADQLPDFTIKLEPSTYHRIAGVIIRGVEVAESPNWLKQRLRSVGLNSINRIVDLTNYVMLELGIPIHAFDLDRLPAPEFQVRLSKNNEKFTSLKDENPTLPTGAIIVESGDQIIDLLGIRGGKVGMIRPDTKNILVWATSLPRPLIRQAVRATGIRTEGSYRHERETDWAMVPVALGRVVQLLTKTGGQISSAVDRQAEPLIAKKITLDSDRVNHLLGSHYQLSAMVADLKRLGYIVDDNQVTVPSWRYFDITCLEDLAEEIARLKGYERLPRRIIPATLPIKATLYSRLENLKDQLVEAGLVEIYTESLAGRQETLLSGHKEDNLAVLANPVSRDYAFCRPALAPGLLKFLALNAWSDEARIFEIGTVFPAKDLELTHLALAAYGDQRQLFNQWLPQSTIQLIRPDHPLAKYLKLRRSVTIGESAITEIKLKLGHSFSILRQKPTFQLVSTFPPAARDLAIVVDQSVAPAVVIEAIKTAGPPSLILVELFDQFTSDRFGSHRHSLAFHLVYQSLTATLDSQTVEQDHQSVIDLVKSRFKADIR